MRKVALKTTTDDNNRAHEQWRAKGARNALILVARIAFSSLPHHRPTPAARPSRAADPPDRAATPTDAPT
jgi:hypothetical protein